MSTRQLLGLVVPALLALSSAFAQQTVTFSSSGAITLPTTNGANATPYPTSPLGSCSNGACINVSGMAGAVQDVKLRFNSFNNTGAPNLASNLGILLESPDNRRLVVMSNACKATGSSTFTLTDSAGSHAGAGTNCFSTLDWKPTTHHFTGFALDNFSAPGPGTTYQRAEPDSAATGSGGTDVSNGLGTFAAVFGTAPSANGVWRLYITSAGTMGGSIGSWDLIITTAGAGASTTVQTLTSTLNPSFTSSSLVTLVANVTSGAGTVNVGNVTFQDLTTNTTLGTQAVNGSGSASLSNVQFTTEGVHRITATYNGAGGFAASPASSPLFQAVIRTTISQSPLPSGTTSGFCNPGGITLPTAGAQNGQGPGNPYPSAIVVSGQSGIIQNLRVYINGYTSSNPQPNTFLLVGPNNKTLEFQAWAGGSTTVSNLNLVWDDFAASQSLPNTVSFLSQSYKPTSAVVNPLTGYCTSATCNLVTVSEPAPASFDRAAPAGSPAATFFSQFAGAGANGTWKLFTMQNGTPATASINNWCVNFTMTTGTATTTTLTASPNPATTGAAVTLTATVNTVPPGSPINSGSVTFSDSVTGSNLGTSSVVNGVATLSNITTLSEGTHIITAAYTGNSSFGPSSDTDSLRINNATTNPSGSRFCNVASGIAIPDPTNGISGPAYPYPSNIIIPALAGSINSVKVDLNGYTSSAPQSLQSLLVGPCQLLSCSIDFFSNPLHTGNLGPLNLSFFDAAASTIPAGAFGSGSYQPYSRVATNSWTSPAPAGPYRYAAPGGAITFNGTFANSSPVGTWSLYMLQNIAAGNASDITGWCVDLTMNQPQLAVVPTHTGPGAGNAFIAGQAGSYTLAVTNNGPGPTGGVTVTLTNALPVGFTIASVASGVDWNCSSSTSTNLICTSTTNKAAGQSFTNVTVGVNVALTAPASVTNTPGVSAPGATSTASSDTATVLHFPIFSLSSTNNGSPSGTFTQGATGGLNTVTLANASAGSGAGDATGTTTVTFTPTSGLTLVSLPNPAGFNCVAGSGIYVCTSTATMFTGTNRAFAITFDVAANATSPQSITTAVTYTGVTVTPRIDSFTITQAANIAATKTSTGTFQNGAASGNSFTIGATNTGGATTAAITLVDNLNAFFTPTSLPANCTGTLTAGATVTCTIASLAANASTTFVIPVSVASTATGTPTNAVTASGGGGQVGTPTATINVPITFAKPGVTKSFSPTVVASNGVSVVTLAISNTNGVALSNASLSDTLAGLTAQGGAIGGTCTGVTPATLVTGATSLSFTIASLPAGGCTLTFGVIPTSAATKTNATGGVTTTQTTVGAASNTATLAVWSTLTANSGTTPQSVAIGSAFTALAVTLTDSQGNPVSGAAVTFTAPGSGASGTFSNSTNTITVNTNGSGVASAPFTANNSVGAYSVTTTVSGFSSTPSFALTNTAGGAASVAVSSGSGQSAQINAAFGSQLVALVRDSGNNPVSGVTVTFAGPLSGAGIVGTPTAVTNGSGLASVTVTANGTAGGPYSVTASAPGAGTSATFSLTNTAGGAATVAVSSGSGQSAQINAAFATQLVALVRDSGNNPVSGVTVTFAGPLSGAGIVGTPTAVTNGSGLASVTVTANGTAGGPYSVTASAPGAGSSATFSLTNTAGGAATVAVSSGSGQSAQINAAFATQLVALVQDSGNNPVSGVTVTFAGPLSGAGIVGTPTAVTNGSGLASVTVTANGTAGGPYSVTASAPGAGSSATFSLTNTAGGAATVAVSSGSGQSAQINAAFGSQLVALVRDSGNNPVSGVTVTFAGPLSGAGIVGTPTAVTNGSGLASVTVTANGTAGGPYSVTASAPGAGSSATFSLTNTAGGAATVAVSSGSGQSAQINAAFATQLVALVRDSGNNPVSGVTVTFAGPLSGAGIVGTPTAVTNGSGLAAVTVTANGTAGGPYNVTASAPGAGSSATFALTNTAGSAATVTISSGSGQTTAINTLFGSALVALVRDAGNNPVSGVTVTFAGPLSGAGIVGTPTAVTNGSGLASVTVTANGTPGGPYSVTASAPGAGTTANFSLTNSGPAGPANLFGRLSAKTGARSARVWTVEVTNAGPGTANNTRVDTFTLTQTSGAACSPIVSTALPAAVGTLAPSAVGTMPVTIDFSPCGTTARFSLNSTFSANSGAATGSFVVTNQFP